MCCGVVDMWAGMHAQRTTGSQNFDLHDKLASKEHRADTHEPRHDHKIYGVEKKLSERWKCCFFLFGNMLKEATKKPSVQGGYADERFAPPGGCTPDNLDDFRCSFCLKVQKDPVKLTCCSHSFCRECIGRWTVTQQEQKADVCCPLCRRAYKGHQDFAPLTLPLQISCACGWSGSVSDEPAHRCHVPPSPRSCAICRNPMDVPCITCDAKIETDGCLDVQLSCGHDYHNHCMRRWTRSKGSMCPLDDVALKAEDLRKIEHQLD